MAGLTFSQIDDAVLLTQQSLIKRGAFVDLQTDLQDHVAVRELWKGRQKKFEGGHPWRFQAQIDHNHSARAVGLYETDGSSSTDTMIQGQVDIRHVNAHYIFDQREPDFQRGGAAIVDYVKTKYVGMMISFFEYLETTLWGKPIDSADEKTPFGLEYWITRSESEGFYGAAPSGFSAGKAGILHDRWRNWTAPYDEVTKEDLIRKMRRMHMKTRFRSPVSHAVPDLGAMKNGIYTNDNVLPLMEELLEAQNMNLGTDLASMDGRAVFKSTPIQYVPKLDSDAGDPVYMLDWKCGAIGVLPGWENNLGKPYMVSEKHTVRRVDLDASLNMIFTDLRRQGVIAKVV